MVTLQTHAVQSLCSLSFSPYCGHDTDLQLLYCVRAWKTHLQTHVCHCLHFMYEPDIGASIPAMGCTSSPEFKSARKLPTSTPSPKSIHCDDDVFPMVRSCACFTFRSFSICMIARPRRSMGSSLQMQVPSVWQRQGFSEVGCGASVRVCE